MFRDKVFAKLRQVPKGKVTTYAALARAIGQANAARAVGNALNSNTDFKNTPCHRVIRSDGRVGGFALGAQIKVKYLLEEGVKIENGKVLNFMLILHKFK